MSTNDKILNLIHFSSLKLVVLIIDEKRVLNFLNTLNSENLKSLILILNYSTYVLAVTDALPKLIESTVPKACTTSSK